MTVEDLLKQLKDERRDAEASVWIYGSRAMDAKLHDDPDDAKYWTQKHNECYDKAEQLKMIIDEIEKRVS